METVQTKLTQDIEAVIVQHLNNSPYRGSIEAAFILGSLINEEYFDEFSDIDLIILTNDEALGESIVKDLHEKLPIHLDAAVVSVRSYLPPLDRDASKFCVLTQSYIKKKLIYGQDLNPEHPELKADMLFCLNKKSHYYQTLLTKLAKRFSTLPTAFKGFDRIYFHEGEHFLAIKTLSNLVATKAAQELFRLNPQQKLVAGKQALLDAFLNNHICREQSALYPLMLEFSSFIKTKGRKVRFSELENYEDWFNQLQTACCP